MACLLATLLVLGCTAGVPDSASAETGETAETGVLGDGGEEGVAVYVGLGWGGGLDGGWAGGQWGVTWYSWRKQQALCSVLGRWVDAGGVAPPCPDCTWAFQFAVEDSTADGSGCALLVEFGVVDGSADGATGAFAWLDVDGGAELLRFDADLDAWVVFSSLADGHLEGTPSEFRTTGVRSGYYTYTP